MILAKCKRKHISGKQNKRRKEKNNKKERQKVEKELSVAFPTFSELCANMPGVPTTTLIICRMKQRIFWSYHFTDNKDCLLIWNGKWYQLRAKAGVIHPCSLPHFSRQMEIGWSSQYPGDPSECRSFGWVLPITPRSFNELIMGIAQATLINK